MCLGHDFNCNNNKNCMRLLTVCHLMKNSATHHKQSLTRHQYLRCSDIPLLPNLLARPDGRLGFPVYQFVLCSDYYCSMWMWGLWIADRSLLCRNLTDNVSLPMPQLFSGWNGMDGVVRRGAQERLMDMAGRLGRRNKQKQQRQSNLCQTAATVFVWVGESIVVLNGEWEESVSH